MSIWSKLFSKRRPQPPDNSRLSRLLMDYWEKSTDENYEQVVLEFMKGRCFLLLPTGEPIQTTVKGWQTTESNQKIKLASVYTVTDHKVLAGFTDEQALLAWSKKPFPYVSLVGRSVLEICEANQFSRLIINPASEKSFVMQRSKPSVEEYSIQEGTEMEVGTPNNPLDREVIERLIRFCEATPDIEKVYHYCQTVDRQFSLVLAFIVLNDNKDITDSIISVVQKSLAGHQPPAPLDVQFIGPYEDLSAIKAVKNAMIYKRK